MKIAARHKRRRKLCAAVVLIAPLSAGLQPAHPMSRTSPSKCYA